VSSCLPEEPLGPRPEPPNPEVVEFIRFCRARRRVGWPELYDEMILVACRGHFHGYGFAELAERGVVFSLAELPRLAALVARVAAEERPPVRVGTARRGRAVLGGRVVGREEDGCATAADRGGTETPVGAPVGLPALASG